jgi:hypothetical protein
MATTAVTLREGGNGAAEGKGYPGQQRWQSGFAE